MTRDESSPVSSLADFILTRYKAAGLSSPRAVGIAYAEAKGISTAAGIRAIRRYTKKNGNRQSRITEPNALALANVLKVDPAELEPFLTRRAGGDVARMDEIENRLSGLESQLGTLLRELRDLRSSSQRAQDGDA